MTCVVNTYSSSSYICVAQCIASRSIHQPSSSYDAPRHGVQVSTTHCKLRHGRQVAYNSSHASSAAESPPASQS